jgi:ATP-dependent exoDNAse (exonuclease V) alpha subunit
VLREKLDPILTRELFYTGVTPAKTLLTQANPDDEQRVSQAVERRGQRASGLLEKVQESAVTCLS